MYTVGNIHLYEFRDVYISEYFRYIFWHVSKQVQTDSTFTDSKCNWVYHAMSKGELELPSCTEKSETRNRSNCPQ